MFTMNVSKYFLGEVVLIAAYLINKILSRIIKFKTPCETLLSCYPNIRIITSLLSKKICCTMIIHVSSQHQSKLDFKAIKCMFLDKFISVILTSLEKCI